MYSTPELVRGLLGNVMGAIYVLLEDDTTGVTFDANVEIGDFVIVLLGDENGLPVEVSGIIKEFL